MKTISVKIGNFPDIQKLAIEVPIFKIKARLLCNNYRTVSLLLNIGQIIEDSSYHRLSVVLE